MRFLAPLAAGLCVAGLALAQTPSNKAAAPKTAAPKAAAPAPDPRKMDLLLDQWEEQSGKTTSMVAAFVRTDFSSVWETTTKYTGQALLKSPNYACLEFRKVVDPQKKPEFHERIICSGDKVFQFVQDSRQIFEYPLDPNERKRALEEGPLPFLFNMKAADAKSRYRMRVMNENADLYLIGIAPIHPIDQEAFSKAFVWLDRKTFLPRKLQLSDPKNGKDTKTFEFTKIARNIEIDMKNFDGEAITKLMLGKKWDLVVNPGPDSQPPATARPAVGPVPKPAQRSKAGRRPG
jgi:TIGR03009 family protein